MSSLEKAIAIAYDHAVDYGYTIISIGDGPNFCLILSEKRAKRVVKEFDIKHRRIERRNDGQGIYVIPNVAMADLIRLGFLKSPDIIAVDFMASNED